MADVKEQLAMTVVLAKNDAQFRSNNFAATAAKGFDGAIRLIISGPGDEWYE